MRKLVIAIVLGVVTPVVAQPKKANHDRLLYELTQSIDNAWSRDRKTKAWVVSDAVEDGFKGATCTRILADLTKAGVHPNTTKITLLNDTPELLKGEHTLAEVAPVCEQIERIGKIKAWEEWAVQAMRVAARIDGEKSWDEGYFKACVTVYDDLMKAGIPPTMKVPERMVGGPDGNDVLWSGTVEELRKKHCDVGLKKVRAEIEAKQAPYRKALKADKLAMALQSSTYLLAGGKPTSDPNKLASATVWFAEMQSINSDRQMCNGTSEILTLRRFQFDRAHKLVKTTETQHCGRVPANAFK